MENKYYRQKIVLYRFRLTFKVKDGYVYRLKRVVWASCASVACDVLIKRMLREGIKVSTIISVIREAA